MQNSTIFAPGLQLAYRALSHVLIHSLEFECMHETQCDGVISGDLARLELSQFERSFDKFCTWIHSFEVPFTQIRTGEGGAHV